MLHGIFPAVPAGGEGNAVHLGLAAAAGINVQSFAVCKGEIQVQGGHVVHRDDHITGAQIPQHTLVRDGDHIAGLEVLAACQHGEDADGARIRQLPEAAVLEPAVLAQPGKGAPDDHHADEREHIPHGQGEDFVNLRVQGNHLL